MRQQHDVAQHAQAGAVDLRMTGPVRRPVVKEHDPVRQRHGARGPRDHRRAQDGRHVEQVQDVGQHADVPARQDQGGAVGDQGRHGRAVATDHRPVVRPQPLVEPAAHAVDLTQVGRVKLTDRLDGRDDTISAGLATASAAAAPLQRVDRPQRMIQPQQVDLLKFGQHLLQPLLARGVLGVAVLHVQPAPVQSEVGGAAAEQRAQLAVVALPLLPAGGYRGDRPVQAQRPDHRAYRGPALRPEQDDPHEA